MRIQIQAERNSELCEKWDKKKNNWTMQDLAEFYGINLQHAYRILKVEKFRKEVGVIKDDPKLGNRVEYYKGKVVEPATPVKLKNKPN